MLCQQTLSGVVYVQPVCWGFVLIPVFVQFHFSLPWSSNKLWQQAQVFVLSTARLYPFDSNVETHHPEHGSLPSLGFVPAGQTLSRGQTQHRSELSETEVFRRCMSKCSCSQSALGLCGLLPSLKGKATVVYVKDPGRVKWKWLLAKCTWVFESSKIMNI